MVDAKERLCSCGAHLPDTAKHTKCKSCYAQASRRWKLKHRYNITTDEYAQRLKQQHGKCAICHGDCPTGKQLAVDHDHKTGAVRGLLCTRCNVALGHLGDSVELLARAIVYLSSTSGRSSSSGQRVSLAKKK